MFTYFVLGFLAAMVAGLLWLRSARRIRFAVRILSSIADAIDGRAPRTAAPGPELVQPVTVVDQVASALQNFGAKKKAAIAAARQASAELGSVASFDDLFRVALALTRKAA
jgi:hypothetical protein